MSVQVQVRVEVVRARGVASIRAVYQETNPKTGRYPDFILIIIGDQSSAMFLILVVGRWAMKKLLFARERYWGFAVQR